MSSTTNGQRPAGRASRSSGSPPRAPTARRARARARRARGRVPRVSRAAHGRARSRDGRHARDSDRIAVVESRSMPLDPARTVAELERAARADRRRERRPARRLDGRRGTRRGTGCAASSPAPALEYEIDEAGNQWFTLRGASRARAADRRPHRLGAERRLARRLPERRRRRRGAAADRRGGRAAGHGAARQLGRRGGRALRPLAVRLVGRGRLDGRPGRAARSCTDRDGIALPDALREHGVDLDRALDARAQLENAAAYLELHIEQGPVLESMDLPLGVVLGTFGVERSPDHLARPGGARRLDADGQAPRRARRRREARARDPRDRRRGRRAAPSARRAASSASPGSSPRSSRRPSSCSTSATSTRTRSRAMLAAGAGGVASASPQEENIEVEWERIWNIEPILFDETLIELRRRGDPRGRRHVAPPAERARCTTPPRSRARASRR